MNKNGQNHFKKNLIVMLTLIFVLGYTNSIVYGVSFPDYFPLDASSHGIKTFQWMYGNTSTYSSSVSGTLIVPYTSGAIQGTGIVNFEEGMTLYATNDGAEVKLLSINNAYFSTDQFLTAHPAAWTFSTVTDDMLVDIGIYYDVHYDLTSSYLQEYLAILFDIQDVTIPLGQQSNAVIMWFLDENYSFTSLNFYGKDVDLGIILPDSTQTGGRSVTDFMIYSNGIGMIAVGDIDAESGELVNLAELVDVSAVVDVDLIWFKTENNYTAGTPETEPFDIGALVFGSNLNSVKVTSPAYVTEYLEEGPGYWYWDREEKFASLEDLYVKFPIGNYEFTFNEGQANEDSAIVYVNPEYPTGFGNITNPADGATDVPLNPTFEWNSCSTYGGDILFVGVGDIMADEDIYMDELNTNETSWTPGPLPQGRLCSFGVSVQTRSEVSGTTDNGDTFNFRDVGQWSNGITFTTVPPPSDLDIDLLGISATKQFRDGVPQGELPWSLDIIVSVGDPDNLHHIDVTKPGDSVPFVTLYKEATPVGMWGCSLDDDYASLDALRIVYKEGPYIFNFLDIDNVLIRSLNIDYTDLPGEPAEPVEFIYPSTNGQNDISINPTFTWSVSQDAGDALMMAIDNDETVYFDAPVPIGSTSWTPGPLLEEHQYELDVFVINIKDWAGGPGFPTMTDSTGDTFSYAHTIEYLNEIAFTTQSLDDPIEVIEEILDFVDESVDVGTLTGEGPGKSADNRLNALRNKLEEAQRLIEAGLYEEACDQLWSTYRKCDGEPRPPDFVTGDAADDLADMILVVMDELGCD